MTNNIWPEEVQESVNKLGGTWLKGTDFDGDGITLQLKGIEKVISTNPKYGAIVTDYLVKNEVLEIGETFHYVFLTKEGEEKQFDSKSTPFFIGMKNAECEIDDWINIRREGERDKTRYFVEKV